MISDRPLNQPFPLLWAITLPPRVNQNRNTLQFWILSSNMRTWKVWEIYQNEFRDLGFFVNRPHNSVGIIPLLGKESSGWRSPNLGVGIVSLICSSLLATGLPVLDCTGLPNVASRFQGCFTLCDVDTELTGADGLTKTSPDVACEFLMSFRKLWLRLNTPRRLGTTAGWLGTWDNPPLQDWFDSLEFPRVIHRAHSILQFLYLECELNFCSLTFSQILLGAFVTSHVLHPLQFFHFMNFSNMNFSKCSFFVARILHEVWLALSVIARTQDWYDQSPYDWTELVFQFILQNLLGILAASDSNWFLCSSRNNFALFSDSESLDNASSSPWTAQCAKEMSTVSEVRFLTRHLLLSLTQL